jgi:hypothetical protein
MIIVPITLIFVHMLIIAICLRKKSKTLAFYAMCELYFAVIATVSYLK